MSVAANTCDFPFVSELPKREQKKVLSLWDELDALTHHVRENGMPITIPMVAVALGVSRPRVHQFIDAGRLETIVIAGKVHVTKPSLYAFAARERVNGRPFGWRKDSDK